MSAKHVLSVKNTRGLVLDKTTGTVRVLLKGSSGGEMTHYLEAVPCVQFGRKVVKVGKS
jgi:hypothetical protein